jgi:hypothetical protein
MFVVLDEADNALPLTMLVQTGLESLLQGMYVCTEM